MTNVYANVLLLIGVALVFLEFISILLIIYYAKYLRKHKKIASFATIKSHECATLLARYLLITKRNSLTIVYSNLIQCRARL